jgi:hypothetical protein
MKISRWSLFFVAAALIAGCAKPDGGGSTASGAPESAAALPEEVTLRVKAAEGDTFTMDMEMDTEVMLALQPGATPEKHTMSMKAKQKHTAKEVKDGKITWEIETLEASGTGTGPFEAQAKSFAETEKGKKETRVTDERNKTVESGSESPFTLEYPEKAIKVGDSWTTKAKMLDTEAEVTFKLERFERVGDKTAAVISASVAESQNLKLTKPLLVFVDVSNGWPIKGEAEFESKPMGMEAKLRAKFSAS